MNHTLLEVLSVWWVVALIDLSVVYVFWKIANNKKTDTVYYLNKADLPDNHIP